MKTLTLSEAFAKATKGPIEAQFICGGNYSLVVSEHSKFASSWTLGNIHGQGCDTENAALLAHCFNHFQEAVEILAQLEDALTHDGNCQLCDGSNDDGHDDNCRLLKARTALTKANQVTLP